MVKYHSSKVVLRVQFPSLVLMDIHEVYEMAEEMYPDDVDSQDDFVEGVIMALHVASLAELKGMLADG